MRRRMLVVGAGVMSALILFATPALAQITTGTVSGSVKDSTGGIIPGATVVLTSETRGTKSAPALTNESGTYVFPNITPDIYTGGLTHTENHTGVLLTGQPLEPRKPEQPQPISATRCPQDRSHGVSSTGPAGPTSTVGPAAAPTSGRARPRPPT